MVQQIVSISMIVRLNLPINRHFITCMTTLLIVNPMSLMLVSLVFKN